MIRQIINIDEEKCNGCGACATACHEGAIGMIDGKAKLLRDDYCDGLGDCLPQCPTGAITFVQREALAYDEVAVKEHQRLQAMVQNQPPAGGCLSTRMRTLTPKETATEITTSKKLPSQLGNWPVQIKLAPVNAPYFSGAKLLIAADCTAYSYANFHDEFIKGKVTLIGCPKLDSIDYSEKLTQIIAQNDIESVTIVRMEVPCCGGLEMAVKKALQDSGKFIPWQVVTLSIDGNII
ncbi:4Fe-4S binding protein [uncultured Anaerovibrio sp.]|uniref:4Fe-4S binding protein n=1 Tax=uncultured Anaerovibrio sp. TaxID=361586 RepID=UPI0025E2FB34|nr:4Fe-4S binding protein [uncultured Anaerovibrio sp.]